MACKFKDQCPFLKEERKDPFKEVRKNHTDGVGTITYRSGWPQIVALVGKAYGFGTNRLYSDTLASDTERAVAVEFATKLSDLYIEYRMLFLKAAVERKVMELEVNEDDLQ